MSKPFHVDLNSQSKQEIDEISTKLKLLYKDYSMYQTLGKMMRILNFPTCIVYPKDIEADVILPSIESSAAKVESITRQKVCRYNWTECPGIINLNSSYNYIGTDVNVKCY